MIDQESYSVGCVVLAAGNSTRFGANKLTAVINGKMLIEHALDAIPVKAFAAVCVVTQYDKVEALARARGFLCARNDRPQDGLSHSVCLGTQMLQTQCDAILYLVSDQPLLRMESIASLIDFSRAHPEHIVSAARSGKRGNPCVFPARFFPALCALSGDVGGSAVIRQNEDALLLYEVGARELADIDTQQALEDLTGGMK